MPAVALCIRGGIDENRADALDAVQDTFVVALLRPGDVRDVGAVRAWLHAVLRNICRARIRQRREVPTEEVVGSPGSVPGPEEALETHVMREWVWQALDGLNPDERLTVMLRHFSRYSSYEAIARITAVSGRDGPQSPPPRPVTFGRCAHEDRRQFDEPCRPGIRSATAMG